MNLSCPVSSIPVPGIFANLTLSANLVMFGMSRWCLSTKLGALWDGTGHTKSEASNRLVSNRVESGISY